MFAATGNPWSLRATGSSPPHPRFYRNVLLSNLHARSLHSASISRFQAGRGGWGPSSFDRFQRMGGPFGYPDSQFIPDKSAWPRLLSVRQRKIMGGPILVVFLKPCLYPAVLVCNNAAMGLDP